MTDTPRPPTPLETAQQRLETAERATLHARAEVARAAVDQERREDGDSAAVDRAARRLGISRRTLYRWIEVTKNVTSQDGQ